MQPLSLGGDRLALPLLWSPKQWRLEGRHLRAGFSGSGAAIGGSAEKADPWLIDKASAFCSEHLTLIKTMGGGALTVGASGRIVAVLRDFAADVLVEP